MEGFRAYKFSFTIFESRPHRYESIWWWCGNHRSKNYLDTIKYCSRDIIDRLYQFHYVGHWPLCEKSKRNWFKKSDRWRKKAIDHAISVGSNFVEYTFCHSRFAARKLFIALFQPAFGKRIAILIFTISRNDMDDGRTHIISWFGGRK